MALSGQSAWLTAGQRFRCMFSDGEFKWKDERLFFAFPSISPVYSVGQAVTEHALWLDWLMPSRHPRCRKSRYLLRFQPISLVYGHEEADSLPKVTVLPTQLICDRKVGARTTGGKAITGGQRIGVRRRHDSVDAGLGRRRHRGIDGGPIDSACADWFDGQCDRRRQRPRSECTSNFA